MLWLIFHHSSKQQQQTNKEKSPPDFAILKEKGKKRGFLCTRVGGQNKSPKNTTAIRDLSFATLSGITGSQSL